MNVATGALALLLIVGLGRVLPLLGVGWPRLSAREPRRLVLVGSLVLAGLAAGLIGTAATAPGLARGAGLALLATGLLAWWQATRLRLSVRAFDAQGTPDPGLAALVGARLSELGGDRPQGATTPVGTDVTRLAGALEQSATRPARLLSTALGATPWQLQVTRTGPGSAAVGLTRNGRTRSALAVGPAPAATSTVPPDETVAWLAAAPAVLALAAEHGPFPGLAGATDQHALGLHALATGAGLPAEDSLQLLAAAVERDPASELAQIALQAALWREAATAADLGSQQRWLGDFLARTEEAGPELGPDLGGVRLRAAFTRAVAAWKRSFLTAAESDFRQSRRQLDELLERAAGQPDLAGLRTQIAAARDCLAPGPAGRVAAPAPELVASTPTAQYLLGSWWAAVQPATEETSILAVSLLQRAAVRPELRAAVARDPQLRALRGTRAFRAAFLGPARTDFFELAPIAPYARLLVSLAYSTPGALACGEGDPHLLRGLGLPGRSHAVGLAALYVRLSADPTLAPAAVEILHELTARRLTTPAACAELGVEDRGRVATAVVQAITERCRPFATELTAARLVTWWDVAFPLPEVTEVEDLPVDRAS